MEAARVCSGSFLGLRKLIVAKAIKIAINPVVKNIHQLIFVL